MTDHVQPESIDLGDEFETPVEKPPQGDEKSAADIAWDDADHWAEDDAAAIEYAIEFSRNKLETSAIDQAEYGAILNGLEVLDGLVRFAGLDYRGILRRRALIPFVLVPRRVAATSGSAEKLCRMLRDQVFGTLVTLAVIDQKSPKEFANYVKVLGVEFARRARQEPDAFGEKMSRAEERYVFI